MISLRMKKERWKTYKIKVCFRIRNDLYEMIKTLAKTDKITIQETIEDMLKIGYVKMMEVKGIEKDER